MLKSKYAEGTLISIHAPTRGATRLQHQEAGNIPLFQSTLPQGERLMAASTPLNTDGISIHAPTRGATLLDELGGCKIRFQSTLPQGERRDFANIYATLEISIHAPTRGATVADSNMAKVLDDFNPRSHKGSDDKLLRICVKQHRISIHAPTRGATYTDRKSAKEHDISIHAPTRGAT